MARHHATRRVGARRRLAPLLFALALGACGAEVAGLGPPVTAPAFETGSLRMADGARLPLREAAPDGPPRAQLLALHGMASHAGFFLAESAPPLVAGGLRVLAYDQRGHGNAPSRGIFAGEAALVSDAIAAIRLLRARDPGLPLFVIGESLGANVALLAADRLRATGETTLVDGWILLVPGLYTLDEMRPGRAGPLRLAIATMPRAGAGSGAPTLGVTDNHESMARAEADPLALRAIRADLVAGVLGMHGTSRATLHRCCAGPTLFLFGAQDGVTEEAATILALRTLPPGSQARTLLYPDGWHVLLRDLQRDTVARDILAFTGNPTAPPPSGTDRTGQAWLAQGRGFGMGR